MNAQERIQNRRHRIAQHRTRVRAGAIPPRPIDTPAWSIRIVYTLARMAGLAVVAAILYWAWHTAADFIADQHTASVQTERPLFDIRRISPALTPDSIEHWLLSFRLDLRAEELQVTHTDDARLRPFTIAPGEPALYIAYRLQAEEFIQDADLLNLYLRVHGLDRYLDAGNFLLSGSMTIPEIAAALQAPSYEEVTVTLPEGLRMEEIAMRLEEHFVIDRDTFLQAVSRPREMAIFDDYTFLADLPPDAGLEGYLFPDTYRFPVRAENPDIVLAKFLDNFDTRIGRDRLQGSRTGLAGRELVILASIIEREAVLSEERPLIASVYLNRLDGQCASEVRGLYLESDPTVQFPLGNAEQGWWPPIQIEDYRRVDSPYNTFLYPGLPPGPIANPGLSSLEAAYAPAQTVYCFFHTAGPDGNHAFARTYAEHQQNVTRYGSGP